MNCKICGHTMQYREGPNFGWICPNDHEKTLHRNTKQEEITIDCKYDLVCGEWNRDRLECKKGGGVSCIMWKYLTDQEVGFSAPIGKCPHCGKWIRSAFY